MKKGRIVWTGLLSILGMAIIILDSKTALAGAKDGIEMCLSTVIPSLFPFLIFSVMMNTTLSGRSIPVLRPIGKLCGIPAGCESILVLGLIGGYPVGAQGIADAVNNGKLTLATAKRMLGFCNNAGPSFIFGMLSVFFSSTVIPWFLWLIQILSALFIGAILPNKDHSQVQLTSQTQITLSQALQKALHTMAGICGWVVFFRIVIAVCSRWFFWLFPITVQVAFSGILELSNGCCNLTAVQDEGVRFLLASAFLSFGGLCVCMQTCSVTGKLGLGMYIPGKILQTGISFLLSAICQPILFNSTHYLASSLVICTAAVILFILWYLQKSSSKMRTVVV